MLGRIKKIDGTSFEVGFGLAEAEAVSGLRIGSLVRIEGRESVVLGSVERLSAEAEDKGRIEIAPLGEILGDGTFSRGVSNSPPLGALVYPASTEDQKAVYAPPNKKCIRIGHVHQMPEIPAHLAVNDLLTKHFAILGSTGSGKSCATALILHAILDACPHGHVIMLDPHGEYGAAFGERAETITIDNLQLPYWLLNFEELREAIVSKSPESSDAEARILKEAVLKAKREHPENAALGAGVTVDTPVPYRLSALKKAIDDDMGTLNKADKSGPYLRLLARLESLTADRRFSFMFSSLMVRDMLADILGRILRIPTSGKPISIIDISGVPAEVTDVVVSVLCRAVFDFALWNGERQKTPILFVCEEAHRYIPEREEAGFAPTKKAIAQIAKEGRKYGVGLCLVTQRPSELSLSILSQCGTLMAMRLSNDRDLVFLRSALPDSLAGMASCLPALNQREAVIMGEAVGSPMRAVFANIPSERLPRSASADYAKAWQDDKADTAFVADAIDRWRQQRRG
jgi:DNA helicase HerA-like ATPase